MGYRDWRERVLARVDEAADRLEGRAAESSARLAAQERKRGAQRDSARDEARVDWLHRRAAHLRENHDDLAARAGALGIPLPSPDRVMRGRVLGALGELVVWDGAGVEGGTVDAYAAWRDRIVIEEQMAAKSARGERLSARDEFILRMARRASRL